MMMMIFSRSRRAALLFITVNIIIIQHNKEGISSVDANASLERPANVAAAGERFFGEPSGSFSAQSKWPPLAERQHFQQHRRRHRRQLVSKDNLEAPATTKEKLQRLAAANEHSEAKESTTTRAAMEVARANIEANSTHLNRTDDAAYDEDPAFVIYVKWFIFALDFLVFVTGLFGNFLVCLSVYRNKSLQTITNYYIVNLAVADFLVILICLPPSVYWDFKLEWTFGVVLCKLVVYLQDISVSVSVLTLTCISIDRWYAICRPLEFNSSKSRAKVIILLIWLVSMLIASPDVIYGTAFLRTDPNLGGSYWDCDIVPERMLEKTIKKWFYIIILFVLPFVVMTISYWNIVNVLWCNETILDSMQSSAQLEEEQQFLRRKNESISTANAAAAAAKKAADCCQASSPMRDTTLELDISLNGSADEQQGGFQLGTKAATLASREDAEKKQSPVGKAADRQVNGSHNAHINGGGISGHNSDNYNNSKVGARAVQLAESEQGKNWRRQENSAPTTATSNPGALADRGLYAHKEAAEIAAHPPGQQDGEPEEGVVAGNNSNKEKAAAATKTTLTMSADVSPANYIEDSGAQNGGGPRALLLLAAYESSSSATTRSAAKTTATQFSSLLPAPIQSGLGSSDSAQTATSTTKTAPANARRRGRRRDLLIIRPGLLIPKVTSAALANSKRRHTIEIYDDNNNHHDEQINDEQESDDDWRLLKLSLARQAGSGLSSYLPRAGQAAAKELMRAQTASVNEPPVMAEQDDNRQEQQRKKLQLHWRQRRRLTAASAMLVCAHDDDDDDRTADHLKADRERRNLGEEAENRSACSTRNGELVKRIGSQSGLSPSDHCHSKAPSCSLSGAEINEKPNPNPNPNWNNEKTLTTTTADNDQRGSATGEASRARDCLAGQQRAEQSRTCTSGGGGAHAVRPVAADQSSPQSASQLEPLTSGSLSKAPPEGVRTTGQNSSQQADNRGLELIIRSWGQQIVGSTKSGGQVGLGCQTHKTASEQQRAEGGVATGSCEQTQMCAATKQANCPVIASVPSPTREAACGVRLHWRQQGRFQVMRLLTLASGRQQQQESSQGGSFVVAPLADNNNKKRRRKKKEEEEAKRSSGLLVQRAGKQWSLDPTSGNNTSSQNGTAATTTRMQAAGKLLATTKSAMSFGATNHRHHQHQSVRSASNQSRQNKQQLQSYCSHASSSQTRFCKLIESRKKAAKMLIVIVIMFGLCYLPVHIIEVFRETFALSNSPVCLIASWVAHWLCYFNSAVNPLIYNLMSGKFRNEFAHLFPCKCIRRPK